MITLTLLKTAQKVVGERLTAKGAQFTLTRLPKHKLTAEVICSTDFYLSVMLGYPDCRRCGIPVVDDNPISLGYHAKCLREHLEDEIAKDKLRKAEDEEIIARKAHEVASAAEEASRQELVAPDEEKTDWWSQKLVKASDTPCEPHPSVLKFEEIWRRAAKDKAGIAVDIDHDEEDHLGNDPATADTTSLQKES